MNNYPLDWEHNKPQLAKLFAQKLENELRQWREKKDAELLALYRSITSI